MYKLTNRKGWQCLLGFPGFQITLIGLAETFLCQTGSVCGGQREQNFWLFDFSYSFNNGPKIWLVWRQSNHLTRKQAL